MLGPPRRHYPRGSPPRSTHSHRPRAIRQNLTENGPSTTTPASPARMNAAPGKSHATGTTRPNRAESDNPDGAAVALDLYARLFEDHPLGEDEFVICADEKTSIQAR